MSLLRKSYLLLILMLICVLIKSENVEEYHINGPAELHSIAMDTFLDYRRNVDPQATLGYDNPLMERAQKHAVKRLLARPDEDLTIKVRI
jgi:hypothetical protein